MTIAAGPHRIMLDAYRYFPGKNQAFRLGNKSRTYSSHGKKYQCNSLGFRGPEFNPDAATTVFAFGCSHTFGLGLNYAETWPSVWVRKFAKRTQTSLDTISLVNFGEPGASNEYITRLALRQCTQTKPTIALVQLTFKSRGEVFLDERLVRVVPWQSRSLLQRALQLRHYPFSDWSYAWRYLGLIASQQQSRTSLDDLLATLTRITLLQDFFRSQGILACISWLQHTELQSSEYPDCADLLAQKQLIDPTLFCDFGIGDSDIWVDDAIDGQHAGRQSHQLFARRMLSFFMDHNVHYLR